jgi:4-hydroxybenzoate polyprenyltransferase
MLRDWVTICRPAHWVKNLFVLAPLLFARQLFDVREWLLALAAAGLFCLMSSAVYAFNDVADASRDRTHPLKRNRPVAAGRIRPGQALVAAGLLAAVALTGAFWLRVWFGWIGLGYLALNGLYSVALKRIAFLDVLSIAAGFILRVVGGAVAIEVGISTWLVVCTFFLACLLGFGKRRHELEAMGDSTLQTRPALGGYTRESLRWAEWITAGVTVCSYLAYTLAPGTVAKFGGMQLVFTLPFPVFGILRYLRLVGARTRPAPTEALITDPPSVLNLAAWVAAVVVCLYALD